MSIYRKGQIIKGCVTGIENYGAFIGLDEYYSGLIHISEISDGYVNKITDYLNVGDTIYCKILEIDEEHFQVKLSIKDIEYKFNNRRLIKESKTGFMPLQLMLPKWVEFKLNEYKIHKN